MPITLQEHKKRSIQDPAYLWHVSDNPTITELKSSYFDKSYQAVGEPPWNRVCWSDNIAGCYCAVAPVQFLYFSKKPITNYKPCSVPDSTITGERWTFGSKPVELVWELCPDLTEELHDCYYNSRGWETQDRQDEQLRDKLGIQRTLEKGFTARLFPYLKQKLYDSSYSHIYLDKATDLWYCSDYEVVGTTLEEMLLKVYKILKYS